MSNVQVAVRCRPFNQREKKLDTSCVIQMAGSQTILKDPKSGHDRTFNFDHSFWTFNTKDSHYINQDGVFEALGPGIMENVFEGFNACVFAYGQTGSGKTYTMMGTHEDSGVTPRICTSIFDRVKMNEDPNISFKVEVSYMEIYNEQVADLLAIGGNKKKALRVREHKVMGPYVEGLARLAVADFEAIETLMAEGNKLRHVAATKMNDQSSRSHAIFTIFFTQAMYDPATKQTGERVSRINLVDLAGSERNKKTGTKGAALKEGANINKSLTTLGLVISELAKNAKKGGKGKMDHIPFRNSTLTWLLKDNLGGNAKTVMIATLSPAADNYDETLSTLRYADRAKSIVNHAVVNEDPNQRLIRELREELERLRSTVGDDGGHEGDPEALAAMKAQMAETEALMASMSQSWEEKLRASETVLQEHRKMLEQHGATMQADEASLKLQSKLPHLVSIGDELATEISIHTLHEGLTRIGSYNGDPSTLRPPEPGEEEDYEIPEKQDIILKGKGVEEEECLIIFKVEHDQESNELREVVTLFPISGNCRINGAPVEDEDKGVQIHHANVVSFGKRNVFRFNHPVEAQRLREQRQRDGGDESSDEESALSPSHVALPSEMLKNVQAEMDRQAKADLEEERARLQAEFEKERLEKEEIMAREARVQAAAIAAKEAEAERKMAELQALMAEAAAAKEAAEAEKQRVAMHEQELEASKEAEAQALRSAKAQMEAELAEKSAAELANAKKKIVMAQAEEAVQNETAQAELKIQMNAKLAEVEAKLAEEKAKIKAAAQKQEEEYKRTLEDMEKKTRAAEALAQQRATEAEAARAEAAIDEDEAEERREREEARRRAQQSKLQSQNSQSMGLAGTSGPTFSDDPAFAQLGLDTSSDFFSTKAVTGSTTAPRRGSAVNTSVPTPFSGGALPQKIAPAQAFAGNPFAPKMPVSNAGGMSQAAAANPFAPVSTANPFAMPPTQIPGASPVANAQPSTVAVDFFSSQAPSVSQPAATQDPFQNPPELPAHSPLRSERTSEDDGHDFNPDSWKPRRGSGLQANAGGYVTMTVAGGDDDSDDSDDSDDDDDDLETSTSSQQPESEADVRARVMAEKAKEIMMLQQALQKDKEMYAEVQSRQRAETKSKRKHFWQRDKSSK